MKITSRGVFSVILIFLLSGCSTLSQPEGVRVDLVLNELKKQIDDIGRYNIKLSPREGTACGSFLKATPSAVTITLKTASNTTINASGNGSIPVSFIVITPKIGGSYSNIQTQTLSFEVGIDQNTLPPWRPAFPPASIPNTVVLKDEALPDLKTAVLGVLESALNSNHQRPCFLPQKLKIQTDFEVQKKKGAGVQINFLVAKIGSDIALTKAYTQSVVVTMKLEGEFAE